MNWQTGAQLHWLERWGGVMRQTLHAGGRVMVTMESHLAFKWREEGKHRCSGLASQLLTVLSAQTCVFCFVLFCSFEQQGQTFLSLNIVDWVSSVVKRPFLSSGLERREITVGCWGHWHFCTVNEMFPPCVFTHRGAMQRCNPDSKHCAREAFMVWTKSVWK